MDQREKERRLDFSLLVQPQAAGCFKRGNELSWIKEQRISLLGHLEKWRRIGCPKRSSLKNWKRREEEEDTGKDGKRK